MKFKTLLLFCANATVFSVVTQMIYGQLLSIYERMKCQQINEVLLSNISSGCCSERNYSKPNNCPNQYCVRKLMSRLIQLIDSSQHSICLAMYNFNCVDLQKALMRAHKRQVKVKILTTDITAKELNRDLMGLIVAGVEVRFPLKGLDNLLHHKFCLLDTVKEKLWKPTELPEHGVVLTGSMNWTMTGICSNWDNFVVTSNETIVQNYQNEFNNMWKRLQK